MRPFSAEDDSRIWEEAAEKARREAEPFAREKREQEKAKAEQEAIQAKKRAELFVTKSTLPYSEALAQEIAERVSCGELLICICNDDHLPTMRRCKQWMNEHEDFAMLYKGSLNDRLDIFEEQVIQIADDASRDFKEVTRNGRTVRVLDGEAIARAKLRVEVRFRHLKAGRPNKWGDVSTLNVKSQDPMDCSNLSTEELERRLAEIEVKDRIMRAA
jgi:hypothetical protein